MKIKAAIVILGASGDLSKKKLIPALLSLFSRDMLSMESVIIGTGRTHFTDKEFQEKFEISNKHSNNFHYHNGIKGLKKRIESLGSFPRVIFFLALPPAVYGSTARELNEEGFKENVSLIIEKPFGYDYDSAHKLNNEINSYFDEHQIFRIDHYNAKEAVQNILVFRFANSLYSPVWNNTYIESIQINAFETIGVEDRGAYFDGAGIIRDMVQNHLMQLLSLVTMNTPLSLDAEEIRLKKIEILKSLRISECDRYQYRGYLEEKGVKPDSNTETYAELKLFIDNHNWHGVPIYIRTGKSMNRAGTEIGIKFKPLPKLLFNKEGNLKQNAIIFKIQPNAGIIVDMTSKLPDGNFTLVNTDLSFCYQDSFHAVIPEAYQKLLLDALRCDQTLFVSAYETELAWKRFASVLDKGGLGVYEKGTVPQSKYASEWLNFESYSEAC
jgi:glucose-6-phosphate 1-dehydrogenase